MSVILNYKAFHLLLFFNLTFVAPWFTLKPQVLLELKFMFKTLLLSTTVSVGAFIAGSSLAADQVELKHVAARVEVIAEPRSDIAVTYDHGHNKLPDIKVSNEGDRVVIDGQIRDHNNGFNLNFNMNIDSHNDKNTGRIQVADYGSIDFKDLPVITIHTPMAVKLSNSGFALGHITRSSELKFSDTGDGDWVIDPVAGRIQVSTAGAGDVHLATGGATEVSSAGSGQITVGDIQSLKSSQAGSGDVHVGHIFGPSHIAIAGSGDFTAMAVKDSVSVSIAGSGDVKIRDGMIARLDVSIAGSGDVRYDGTAADVSVSVMGSGDIRVKQVTGHVSKSIMGSGDVIIGH